MEPLNLQVQLHSAPAGLLRTAVRGSGRSVYVPVAAGEQPLGGPGECVWTDGNVSLFVKARDGENGLAVDLQLVVNPPPPSAARTALVA
jgi:hypothetical protein